MLYICFIRASVWGSYLKQCFRMFQNAIHNKLRIDCIAEIGIARKVVVASCWRERENHCHWYSASVTQQAWSLSVTFIVSVNTDIALINELAQAHDKPFITIMLVYGVAEK